jgi:hypothetical protein
MKTRLDELKEQAERFHNDHPEVWEKFVLFTFDRMKKGYKNYSVYSIMERIRWEMDGGGDGVFEFKINNNITPFYARWFMGMYPEHSGFFRIREQKSLSKPATGMDATPSMVS